MATVCVDLRPESVNLRRGDAGVLFDTESNQSVPPEELSTRIGVLMDEAQTRVDGLVGSAVPSTRNRTIGFIDFHDVPADRSGEVVQALRQVTAINGERIWNAHTTP